MGHLQQLVEGVRQRARRVVRGRRGSPAVPGRRASQSVPGAGAATPPSEYPGDFHGLPPMAYAPQPDGRPDPGEIVWAWVPFEEDHSRGKDRPVLLVGRDGPWLLGLGLTSKDHHRDEEQEARAGRLWVDLGRGPWDSKGRESDVRVNRIIRLDPARIRREGSVLDERRFELIAQAVRAADHAS